jgi:hypothetical protein
MFRRCSQVPSSREIKPMSTIAMAKFAGANQIFDPDRNQGCRGPDPRHQCPIIGGTGAVKG